MKYLLALDSVFTQNSKAFIFIDSIIFYQYFGVKSFIIPLFIIPLIIFSFPFEWEVQIVDPNDEPTGWNSIDADSYDYPHIAYWVDDLRALKYAYFDGVRWNIQAVVGSSGFNFLKLDRNDNPYITHIWGGSPEDRLYLTPRQGSGWITEILDTVKWGIYSSLCFDSNNYPHIAYGYHNFYSSHPPVSKLKYAYFDGSSWIITTVDSATSEDGICYYYNSLQLDNLQRPGIAFTYLKGGPIPYCTAWVKYAYWNGASWQFDTIDYGGQTSLKFNSKGEPQVIFMTGEYPCHWKIGYARKIGNEWLINYFFPSFGPLDRPSFDVDSMDNIHLIFTFYPPNQGMIIYAILRDTSVLYFDTAYISGHHEISASFVLDKRDRPHISAIDNNIFSLIYIKGIPSSIEEEKNLSKLVFKLSVKPAIFKSRTNISYKISNPSFLKLAVYNINGELVRNLESGYKPCGCYKTSWNGRDESGRKLPKGIYFLRLETESCQITKKIIITE